MFVSEKHVFLNVCFKRYRQSFIPSLCRDFGMSRVFPVILGCPSFPEFVPRCRHAPRLSWDSGIYRNRLRLPENSGHPEFLPSLSRDLGMFRICPKFVPRSRDIPSFSQVCPEISGYPEFIPSLSRDFGVSRVCPEFVPSLSRKLGTSRVCPEFENQLKKNGGIWGMWGAGYIRNAFLGHFLVSEKFSISKKRFFFWEWNNQAWLL